MSGAIEITCVLCRTTITVPAQDDTQRATEVAVELHLYHRANHHPKEDHDADPAPASA